MVQRGGLTHRETKGWLFVLLLMLAAVVASLLLKRL